MTNTLAIVLGTLILCGIVADIIWTDAANLLFLSKKFTDMTEWMAFWR